MARAREPLSIEDQETINKSFREALISNKIDEVLLTINNGADVNAKFDNDLCPLVYPVFRGNLELLNVLLAAGAYINAEIMKGATILHFAAEHARSDIIQALITAGADIDAVDESKATPLHHAALCNRAEALDVLLAAGASVDAMNCECWTPLHMAAEKGNIEIINALLVKGANKNVFNAEGYSPLLIAIINDNFEAAKFLIEAGVNVKIPNNRGATPLCMAAEKGAIEIVKSLISAGAEINTANIESVTPLHSAANFGRNDILKILLQSGAKVNTANYEGVTPLHSAVANGHFEVLKTLIAAKANITAAVKDDNATPLCYAVISGNIDFVKLLIEAGANVNSTTIAGHSLLYRAVLDGKIDIIKTLLNSGSDVNLATQKWRAPIHEACENGNEDIVKILLAAGADVNAKIPIPGRSIGLDSLQTSISFNHKEIVKLLLIAGAEVNIDIITDKMELMNLQTIGKIADKISRGEDLIPEHTAFMTSNLAEDELNYVFTKKLGKLLALKAAKDYSVDLSKYSSFIDTTKINHAFYEEFVKLITSKLVANEDLISFQTSILKEITTKSEFREIKVKFIDQLKIECKKNYKKLGFAISDEKYSDIITVEDYSKIQKVIEETKNEYLTFAIDILAEVLGLPGMPSLNSLIEEDGRSKEDILKELKDEYFVRYPSQGEAINKLFNLGIAHLENPREFLNGVLKGEYANLEAFLMPTLYFNRAQAAVYRVIKEIKTKVYIDPNEFAKIACHDTDLYIFDNFSEAEAAFFATLREPVEDISIIFQEVEAASSGGVINDNVITEAASFQSEAPQIEAPAAEASIAQPLPQPDDVTVAGEIISCCIIC